MHLQLLSFKPPQIAYVVAVWVSGVVQTVVYCDFFW